MFKQNIKKPQTIISHKKMQLYAPAATTINPFAKELKVASFFCLPKSKLTVLVYQAIYISRLRVTYKKRERKNYSWNIEMIRHCHQLLHHHAHNRQQLPCCCCSSNSRCMYFIIRLRFVTPGLVTDRQTDHIILHGICSKAFAV